MSSQEKTGMGSSIRTSHTHASSDHQEQEEQKASTPPFQPFSSQFLDTDEAAVKARYTYMRILFLRTCVIIAAMFGVFSIYWGALSSVSARPLQGWIVVRWILHRRYAKLSLIS